MKIHARIKEIQLREGPFLVSNALRTSLKAIGPEGSAFFLKGVRIRPSKETYSHLEFSREGYPDPLSPLWVRPCITLYLLSIPFS